MEALIFLLFLLAFCVAVLFVASYIKAAPDEAILVSGLRKRAKVVIGRAGFRIPFLERADKLSLQLIQIDVKTGSPVPTKDYISVSVDAVVTAKISDDPERLKSSAQNFLNKSIDDIRTMIVDILEGNMREIIGRMQLVDLVGDRKQVSELVLENAIPDLEKLGIVLQTFNIQNFSDANGVIDNLGVDKTAAIRKAAAISKANAERDISVAQSQAKKDANDAAVAAELEIAQKQNDLAVKKANLQKISDTEKAIADAAYEIQKQTQQKMINVAQAEAEVAKQEKEIEIRERMVAVTEKELQAQIEKKAEADRQAKIQHSEALLFEQQKDAEADRYKEEQRAVAIKRIAEAEKERAFAEAEARKAKAEAEASAIKAQGLAQAESIKAQGLAEAEALNKKAEAMKLYGDAARQEMQLKTIEKYFEQLPHIAANIAGPLEKIGSITMYGEGNTAKLTEEITRTLSQVTNGLTDSLGIDLRTVLGSMFGAKLAGVSPKIEQAKPERK
ncbi:MAG: flotillin family protein [Fibrobacterales bacterium]|nr:flotillin family protein [Fibrobacterales bacterium]